MNGSVFIAGYVALVGGIVALLVASACRPASTEEVDDFASVSGIETTNASRHFIAYYLMTGRRLRTVLVLGAVFVPGGVGAAVGRTEDGGSYPSSWQAVLAACLLGTVWAELALTRPVGRVRTASLRPRDIASYLGRPLRYAPAVIGVTATAVWAYVSTLPTTRHIGWDRASKAEVAMGMGFGLGLPVVIMLVQRWIVSRPQPASAASLVDADDAVRAASVRYLGAVGTAMALINLSGGGWEITAQHNGLSDWVFGGGAFLCLIVAWFAWHARKPGVLIRPRRPLRPWATAG